MKQVAVFLVWSLVLFLAMERMRPTISLQNVLSLESTWGSSDRGEDRVNSIDGIAFGTRYRFQWVSNEEIRPEMISCWIDSELDRIDKIFSLYRSDSEIRQFNAQMTTDWVGVSEDFTEVIEHASVMHRETRGALDPTIAPLIRAWGFHELHGDWRPPESSQVQRALDSMGLDKLEWDRPANRLRKCNPNVELDLNSLVEGWAIDRIIELALVKNLDRFLFELGGEFGARGDGPSGKGWRIGIEDPLEPSRLHSKVRLFNQCLSTSGTYRQKRIFENVEYSHAIDPSTGHPVGHETVSVSVLHQSALAADGWSTALLVLGHDEGFSLAIQRELGASFITRQGNVILTPQSQLRFEKGPQPNSRLSMLRGQTLQPSSSR
jgi:FAD:protein FMN transferase